MKKKKATVKKKNESKTDSELKQLISEANMMTKYMEFWEMPPDALQKKRSEK